MSRSWANAQSGSSLCTTSWHVTSLKSDRSIPAPPNPTNWRTLEARILRKRHSVISNLKQMLYTIQENLIKNHHKELLLFSEIGPMLCGTADFHFPLETRTDRYQSFCSCFWPIGPVSLVESLPILDRASLAYVAEQPEEIGISVIQNWRWLR
jgi:hypothetical protein